MRHRKHIFKISRTPAHNRAMIANLLKALLEHGRIKTTVRKAKELKRHADKMITLAKKDTLASRRLASQRLQLSYNCLEDKEKRKARGGDLSAYNLDRTIIKKLFSEIKDRFQTRNGGYTRIIKTSARIGDNAPSCIIELV